MLNDTTRPGSWLRRWIPVTAAALTLVPLQLVARTGPGLDASPVVSIDIAAADVWQPPTGARAIEQRGSSTASAPNAQDPAPAPQPQNLKPVPAIPQSDAEAERLRQTEREAAERRSMELAAAAARMAELAAEQRTAAQRAARLAAEQEQAQAAESRARIATSTDRYLQVQLAEIQERVQALRADIERAMQDSDAPAVESLRRQLLEAELTYARMLQRQELSALPRTLEARTLERTARTNLNAARIDAARPTLDEQVRRMNAQIEAVARAHETLMRQQQTLVDMQQRLAEQLEQLRTSLDRLASDPQ